MSELLRRLAIVTMACIVVACAAPPPPPPPKPPPKPDRIVLLPQADGSPSAVVVRPAGGGETLLSQPYATASIAAGRVQTSVSNADDVAARYKVLSETMPPQRRSYLIYFETGGDRLTPDSAQRLDEILSDVAKLPAPEVLVIGHTDSAGTDSLNDEISVQRARLVRSRLIEKGIVPKSIEAVGRGKRELLVQTRDGVAEARNRRVEIQVR